MVLLSPVEASNARMASSLPAGLVAVFAGATAGIGELALKAFVKHAARPKVYFIGRSQEAGDRLQEELKELNAEGQYVFVKADMSLLKNVDEVCRDIKKEETAVNLLFMSQGTLRFGVDTSEGLPYVTALTLYSRIRLAANLCPLLRQASSLRRVVSTFTAGKEGTLYADDIPGRKVPMRAGRGHLSTAMTLALEALARSAPEVSFIHNFPGAINTNLIRAESGVILQVLKVVFRVTMRHKWMPYDECGERHAFFCTAGMYPPRRADGAGGLPLKDGLEVARGCDGGVGSGVYTIEEDGECSPSKVIDLLAAYRREGMVDKVWNDIEGEFKRIVGSTSI